MAETRKLAAILAADIVGYSRLTRADEDRTLARVRALRSDLIDPTIAVHHGRIVKRTGDGAIVEFRSVVDALRCALEVQNAMVERNAGVSEDQRIVYRIGIHVGDVVEEDDGDLMGDGVNIAARLEGVAKPGAICLSEDAYRQVKGRLDIVVTDLGPTQLKNIAEPVRAYSLQIGTAKAPKVAPLKRRTLTPLAAGVAIVLIAIAAGAWWFYGANRQAAVALTATPPLAPQRLSVVVLPFANLSGDPGQDYLVDALTDELTTGLARIPDSFVIARNTAMTFKGKPIEVKAIGRDLGVRYILEGSVQPNGERLRVNAQLIAADSGAHLWAEQFDTPRADLLQAQDSIVAHLARALHFQLTQAEGARVRKAAADPNAEDLALRCDASSWKAGWVGKEAEAAYALCEQALALDPNNVRALRALGAKYYMLTVVGFSSDYKADLERADQLESKALALDPDCIWAHHMKGGILRNQGRSEDAVVEHQRALALDPSFVYSAGELGTDYNFLGEFDKALEYYDRALRGSPNDPVRAYFLGGKAWSEFALKHYDQAIELARQSIAVNPHEFPFPHAALAAALALSGREPEAREALQRYLALSVSGLSRTIAAWKAVQMSIGGGPRVVEASERMRDGLRKAGMSEQ